MIWTPLPTLQCIESRQSKTISHEQRKHRGNDLKLNRDDLDADSTLPLPAIQSEFTARRFIESPGWPAFGKRLARPGGAAWSNRCRI